ncbi:peptidylprolyl isomerase [Marinifilum sp. RC60d5]|uniref:peptidylprolyl isomerase n=1 Tax=Marinifilum sp. RC60d5 TaxID=3458414 RepID=UPI0040366100
MRKGLLYLFFLLCCSNSTFGQTSQADTLFTINDTPYSADTFINLYHNNKLRGKNKQALSVKDALQLYINFKIKVQAALNNKIDTIPEVSKEIENYRNIAYNSYLYPTNVSEQLLQETFERIKYFVKARHILVKIDGHATPNDTLKAYHKALNIYKSLRKGKRFSKLADQYSDDLSVKKNNGKTGYFTVFEMDYPFETATYKTATGKFSKPVRSKYGYHIIQNLDKVKNPGKVKVLHLMLEFKSYTSEKQAKEKADSLYLLLQKGADFKTLVAKYSDDTNSKKYGGELPWFGLYETHQKIEKAAFNLQRKNEISLPVKTEFGYHLLQLIDKKEYTNFNDCKKELTEQLYKEDRSKISHQQLLHKLKQQYNFKENINLLSNFYSILDYAYAELQEPLFYINDISYSQEAFADFLSQQASKDIYENFKEYINRLYLSFSNNSILAYHKNKLEKKYPELRSLLQEYKDGVLVYFITKYTIWDKPMKNEQDLRQYYQQNRIKYGVNTNFEKSKNQILSDFKKELEQNWLNELKEKYSISINESTFNKIAKNKNE